VSQKPVEWGTDKSVRRYKKDTPMETNTPKKIGDTVKYRNIRTKKVKSGKIKKVEKTKNDYRYELDNSQFVYHSDLEESTKIDEQFERFLNSKSAISESVQKALTEKAEKNALPVDILEEVYHRGCHAYSDKMVITMDQYAFGRVNNFVSGGKTRWTIDVDLWNEIHKRNR